MKRRISSLLFSVLVLLAGCGGGGPQLAPDLVGLRLDQAESRLKDLGIEYEELGGGTFGVVTTANWTVCEQEPAPGAEVHGKVKLIVDRECEASQSGTGEAVVVPDVVGQRLDVAESHLDDVGPRIRGDRWGSVRDRHPLQLDRMRSGACPGHDDQPAGEAHRGQGMPRWGLSRAKFTRAFLSCDEHVHKNAAPG